MPLSYRRMSQLRPASWYSRMVPCLMPGGRGSRQALSTRGAPAAQLRAAARGRGVPDRGRRVVGPGGGRIGRRGPAQRPRGVCALARSPRKRRAGGERTGRLHREAHLARLVRGILLHGAVLLLLGHLLLAAACARGARGGGQTCARQRECQRARHGPPRRPRRRAAAVRAARGPRASPPQPPGRPARSGAPSRRLHSHLLPSPLLASPDRKCAKISVCCSRKANLSFVRLTWQRRTRRAQRAPAGRAGQARTPSAVMFAFCADRMRSSSSSCLRFSSRRRRFSARATERLDGDLSAPSCGSARC